MAVKLFLSNTHTSLGLKHNASACGSNREISGNWLFNLMTLYFCFILEVSCSVKARPLGTKSML